MQIYIARTYYDNGMRYDSLFKTKEDAHNYIKQIKDYKTEIIHMKANDGDLLFALVENYYNSLKNLFVEVKKEVKAEEPWYVYVVECSDGTLYTGATNNVERRVEVHNKGKGAKYTKGRRPVKLIISKWCGSKRLALIEETFIKSMSKKHKLQYIFDLKSKL